VVCCCQYSAEQNAPSQISAQPKLGAGPLVTLETGHESWDIAPPRGARSVVNGDRKFVYRAARGWKCCAASAGRRTARQCEIAQRTGLPKPTVSRLTYTLTSSATLRMSRRLAKYQLAPAALALATGVR